MSLPSPSQVFDTEDLVFILLQGVPVRSFLHMGTGSYRVYLGTFSDHPCVLMSLFRQHNFRRGFACITDSQGLFLTSVLLPNTDSLSPVGQAGIGKKFMQAIGHRKTFVS